MTDMPFKLDVQTSDTIDMVKEKIYREKGIPPDHQQLIHVGQPIDDDADFDIQHEVLEDGRKVAEYGIMDKAEIMLRPRLSGGMGSKDECMDIEEVDEETRAALLLERSKVESIYASQGFEGRTLKRLVAPRWAGGSTRLKRKLSR